ncbi:hypothetical protein PsorP6_009473 [Peronosclerospora sorghi]|uniref:Uncharacterized protein n=1 Tax=Peronosclerospora sorghi TaxID=230839 RepID=A0ACC0W2D5_9STRA|nr:hypothetical protein PsorP6_009473 [Peronosclerospora sorghi]
MTKASARTQRPAHAFCLTKRRSYTSPHLLHARSTCDWVAPVAAPSTRPHHVTRKTQSFSEGLELAPDIAVFLAGSCNPTTWRQDVAMPMLDAARVRYFNPQVDEWVAELIPIETRAKETAQIILVVVDKCTRCLVSIHEAVELICRGRNVMLVIEEMDEGDAIAGKVLSKMELADLNGARQCLRDLAAKRGVQVFPNVAAAVTGCIAWLQQTEAPKSRRDIPRLRKRSSIVLNGWSGKRRPHRVMSRSYSSTWSVESNCSGSTKSSTDESDENCELTSPTQSIRKQLGCQLFSNYTGGSVYLGGNLTATSWRQQVAIPLLRKAGIPVYVPFADYLQAGFSSKAEKHVQARAGTFQEIQTQKANAELILFVIPRNLRSIAAMAEAVELVSSHQAVLLVIEPVVEGSMVEEGVTISGRELDDLIRARAYLREMAERNDVAVFESVTEAVESIIERLE